MLWVVLIALLGLWLLRFGFAMDGLLISGILIGAWLVFLIVLLAPRAQSNGKS